MQRVRSRLPDLSDILPYPACRLVWNRIWAVLSDFFIAVGRHSNLAVAMYAVDSLRQLAMRFLTRDELANYSFQNDFLKPFVVVMRLSKAVEIRELIIRHAGTCTSGVCVISHTRLHTYTSTALLCPLSFEHCCCRLSAWIAYEGVPLLSSHRSLSEKQGVRSVCLPAGVCHRWCLPV